MRTCQGKISLTSVLPEEMWAQFRADIPEGGSTERGAGRTERDKPRPILGPPLGTCGQERQTSRLCWICNPAVLSIRICNPFFRIANASMLLSK